MMALAIAGAVVAAPFGVASAQEGEGPSPQPLTVTQQGYWTRSLGHLAPRTLTDHFPPTAVCLVAPQACQGPFAQGGPLDQEVMAHQPEDNIASGGDPIAEFMAGGKNHLPTAVLAGARRYLSALQFDLPAVPSGHRITSFELHLTPVGDDRLNFHFDSPAFRQAVVAALVAAGRRDPEAFGEELQKVGDDAHPPVREAEDVTLRVEACPILVDWTAGPNQDGATAPERDATERDPEGSVLEQQVNCILGANGTLEDGKWVFDLTLAANAWADGRIPNKGVLLRPVAPDNLAYGDPDLSTWDQLTFVSPTSEEAGTEAKPAFVLATKEKAKPVTLGGARTVAPQVLGSQTETFTEVFGSMEDPQPVDNPAPRVERSTLEQVSPALISGAVTEWWVWMLLPMFLAGIYLTTQALTVEPALAMAERSGAMTRLIEARRRGEL